jgi:hypothetical protein
MSQPSTLAVDPSGQQPRRVPLPQPSFGQTSRKDVWWVTPVAVFLGLSTFVVYSTWAAFQGKHYELTTNGANYLSPFYSPLLFGDSSHAWFGGKPAWWPGFLPFSAALLILWIPAGFRFTCYYYRGAYYKAFWADPPSCSVGEPRKSYWGERTLPLVFQNIHRYFFYLAAAFIFLLAYDVILAMRWTTNGGRHEFGIGVGTLILLVNVILLGCYTFGCHSFRHLMGGWRDEVSKSATYSAYKCSTCLNKKHMLFAWMSLFTVGFSDLYIRLCSMGIWHDWRIF